MHDSPVRHRPLLCRYCRRWRIQPPLELHIVKLRWDWPTQPRPTGAAEAHVHRTCAEPQARTDCPLAQAMGVPQPQHLADLPHRQSLSWHPGPPPFGKGTGLPLVEDCRQHWPSVTPSDRPMTAPTGVHDQLESAFTIRWNERSRSTGISVHVPLEHASREPRSSRYRENSDMINKAERKRFIN